MRQYRRVTMIEETFPSAIRLAGLGLCLREWGDDDLATMVELFDEPQFARWTPLASPFDLPAARAYMAKAREDRLAGRRVQLAVTADGKRALGQVVLIRHGESAVELGYGIGAAHRRQGLATRAVRLMTGFAYDQAAGRVLLCIEAGNDASEAVARATGFRLTDEEPLRRARSGEPAADLRTWVHERERGDVGKALAGSDATP